MIITKTPFRMSFFGGGTDLPGFYEKYGGSVISTTFDKFCYVTVRHLPRFFEYSSEIVYSKIEQIQDVREIEHPLVRESMRYLNMHELRINYESDLPARTGLGTSSSFAVGMLNAFYALKGKYVDKRKLADDAIYVERELCKEAGGLQDQIAASFGGLNRIDFTKDGYIVNPVIISPKKKQNLEENLMLFFTGFSRFSSDIQKSTNDAINFKIQQLQEMKGLVSVAEKILVSDVDIDEFGKLLDYTWKLKRNITSKISTNEIDNIYQKACCAGALGGKLLGAGGGGFLLFYVEKDKQERVKKALDKFMYVPFRFENNGSQILYYAPETYLKGEGKDNVGSNNGGRKRNKNSEC